MSAEVSKWWGRKHRTGEAAPVTAVYQVSHVEHRLAKEVTVLAGEAFPRCSKCAVLVVFEILRLTQGDLPQGKMRLMELPVLDGDEGDEAAEIGKAAA